MNVVGRQMPRSSSSTTTSSSQQHQRQLTDSLLDVPYSTSNKWLLQSANNRSPGSSKANWSMRSLDGLAPMGSRSSNSLNASSSSSALGTTRSSSLRKNGDFKATSDISGLLDLNSFDTDLLSQISVSSQYEKSNSTKSVPENSLPQSTSPDKERANNVAKIKVVVRKRPLNKKEIAKKERDIITAQTESRSLTVHETKQKVDLTEYVEKHEFVFDAVLNENVSNDVVYFETVEPIVPLVFQRTKATCFAYGQTGSGKTYTMQPLPIKASQDILRLMQHTYCNQGLHLFVSFFEIYGGKLFDLLNDRKKLCMREDGKQQVCIVGLQEYRVLDVETIKKLIEKGNAARSTGTTGANEESSRSHAILQLAIKKSTNGSESKPARLLGKLSFIDLAGSERGADTTDNDKQTRIEGAEINKSLLALKECIRALDNDQGHIPFRGSKLTEVLRDSFVGNSRTVMISCISPSSGSCEHTLNTLRYADRVKSLSKSNNSKRDVIPSSPNPRDSISLPLSPPSGPRNENNINTGLNEKNKFQLSKQIEMGTSSLSSIQKGATRSIEGNLIALTSSKSYRGQRGGQRDIDRDSSDSFRETYEQEKQSRSTNRKTETYAVMEDKRKTDSQIKQMALPKVEANSSGSDDDLNALLKEEEELVNAHRKQLEETIDIVKEEMILLVQADQPGNQLDQYIDKLNAILSQKAAGIQQLQNRLTNFQRRLNEHSVLLSSIN